MSHEKMPTGPKHEEGSSHQTTFSEKQKKWAELPTLPRTFDLETWQKNNGIENFEDCLLQIKELEKTIRDDFAVAENFNQLDLTNPSNFPEFVAFLERESTIAAFFEKIYFFLTILTLQKNLDNNAEHVSGARNNLSIKIASLFNSTYSQRITDKIHALTHEQVISLISQLEAESTTEEFSHEVASHYRTRKTLEMRQRERENSILGYNYGKLFEKSTAEGKQNGPLYIPFTKKDGTTTVLTRRAVLMNFPEISDPEEKEVARTLFFETMEKPNDGDVTPLETILAIFLENRTKNWLNAKTHTPESSIGECELQEFGGVALIDNMLASFENNERCRDLLNRFIELKKVIHSNEGGTVTLAQLSENPYASPNIPYEGAIDVVRNTTATLIGADNASLVHTIALHEVIIDPTSSESRTAGNTRHLFLQVGGFGDGNAGTSGAHYAAVLAHEFGHMIHGKLSAAGKNAIFIGTSHITEVAALVGELALMSEFESYTYANLDEELGVVYEATNRLFGKVFKNREVISREKKIYNALQEKGNTLTIDDLTALYHENLSEIYGDTVVLPEKSLPEWALDPRLIHLKPYYSSSYIIATCVAIDFLEKIQSNEPEAQENYTNYLKESTQQNPKEIFLKYGIDLEQDLEKLLNRFADFFEQKLDRLEKLVHNKNNTHKSDA